MENIEKIENEIKQLEEANATLEREKEVLSAKARVEGFQPAKERLQAERGKLYVQTTQLKDKIGRFKEKVAEPKRIILVREARHDIILKVNGTRIRIPENLEIAIPFSCGHELKLRADELFKYQTSIKSNQQLLSFWERTITQHESHSKILVCETCQKQRQERLKKFHTTSNKSSGTARLTVEVI